jgi:sulfofructose kinase
VIVRPISAYVKYIIATGLALATGVDDPGAALGAVARMVSGFVGVTLGAEGYLYRERQRERHLPAPAVSPVDTLAAGDVWHAAFTLALAEGKEVDAAARFDNAAAALKCTRFGGRSGAPARAEVDALLDSISKND